MPLWRNQDPQGSPGPGPQNQDCYLHHKTDFADTIKLKILRWGDEPGGNHNCSDKRQADTEGGLKRMPCWSEDEGRTPGPGMECSKPARKQILPWRPCRGDHALSSGKTIQTSGLQNCKRACKGCLKIPKWWSFATAAREHEHTSVPPGPGHSAGTRTLTSTAFTSPDVFRPCIKPSLHSNSPFAI